MLRWLAKDERRRKEIGKFANSADGMHRLYWEKLLPVEQDHDFNIHHSPFLQDHDFNRAPMVLLLGQYSTGKTTFIRHLLGRDYQGMRIGPEPTTDKFVAVMHGHTERVMPGNAAATDKSLPFTMLQSFGSGFLDKFECSKIDCSLLENITLIDTPGILAGDKQRTMRGYDFDAVATWFADRADMILVLFDVCKMDISDEFQRVLVATKPHSHKMRFLLNKADRVTTPQLMRVYGAMMWNLGKVVNSPEVSRVFVGSFWDEPLANDEQRRLFESEENDLYTQLACLPKSAAIRKLSDLIKRARLARVHAYLLDHLKRKMPSFGKDREKRRLLASLPSVYKDISEERSLTMGDFPDVRYMQESLRSSDFSKFKRLDKAKLEKLEILLSVDLPKLMLMFSQESSTNGDPDLMASHASPFAVIKVNGLTEASAYSPQWLVPPDPEDYRGEFMAAGPNEVGKLSAQKAKVKLVESKLPSSALHKIWSLADVDKDGMLTLYEYALAKHFIKMRLDGQDLPPSLPPAMMPAGHAWPPKAGGSFASESTTTSGIPPAAEVAAFHVSV
uniref:Uncharacterized protein n=1 Tax=Pyrodinium bahamense TaxID=73915 RepID=A0A7S0BAU3_9DINO|mmetsp:Transcript_7763/g.21548  ORF Transcript_7763/g.21548 Transcript_7763/m.21548 type:complete len:560 (+) Transcript_7763:117-1796(+)